ncbi:MAG: M81 family metallopeptidase [Burkholderiaceae bacterium]
MLDRARGPRVAILGFSLEANRRSPVSDQGVFERTLLLQGDQISAEIAGDRAALPGTVQGFCAGMDAYGSWEPVPIVLAEAPPGGPADQHFFEELLGQMRAGLEDAGHLDGVYISEHGAGLATEQDDADGAVFQMARDAVGPDVPIIATLDLHGHVTQRMVDAADVLVAYLTNPHVDQRERGQEAASVMQEMQAGMRPHSAFIKVPMISPAVSLLTANGPYADLIQYGQSIITPDIVNVSILAGFAPADASTNGLSVVVTTRNNQATAQAIATDLATRAWADRHRYTTSLTPLPDCVEHAARVAGDASAPSVLLADVADNPGGGGRGNTTYLLRALHEHQIPGVVVGMIYDPALAEHAAHVGVGNRFLAQINTQDSTQFSEPYQGDAVVEHLVDGPCVGRRGIYANRRVDLGQCALINMDGIRLAIVSHRHQCADPGFLERLGIDLAKVRILVIKSRGHFRAGFDEFFSPEQIVEVDAPGLTTPIIARLDLKRVPRPVYPLDPDMTWAPSK